MGKWDNPYTVTTGHRHGQKSEDRLADSMGAQKTIASGALDGDKGDAALVSGDYSFRIENKATTAKSMSVKHSWLTKIRAEALERNSYPALTVSFVDDLGNAKKAGDWVMIPLHLFKELIGDDT